MSNSRWDEMRQQVNGFIDSFKPTQAERDAKARAEIARIEGKKQAPKKEEAAESTPAGPTTTVRGTILDRQRREREAMGD